jgi:hypothetical protein
VRVLPAICVLVLGGCAAAATPRDAPVAVVWNRVEEPHAVCESLSGRKSFFNIRGCAQRLEPAVEGGPRVCTIYAPAPRSERDLQGFATLGHELMHCFDGNWHDRWGRMNAAQGG